MKIATLIIVILISYTVSAKQKFYKWIDENGNIHYTSEKPENKNANEIKVKTNQPKVTKNLEVTDEIDETDEEEVFTEKSNLEKHKERKKITKKIAQQNKSQCLQARQTVTKYQQQVRMSRTDKKSGEKIYLDDSKREEIIQSAKKAIKKHCK